MHPSNASEHDSTGCHMSEATSSTRSSAPCAGWRSYSAKTEAVERRSAGVTNRIPAGGSGAGSGVTEWLMAEGIGARVLNIGIPDRYIEHGSREDCLKMAGLDADGIFAQVNQRLRIIDPTLPAAGGDI